MLIAMARNQLEHSLTLTPRRRIVVLAEKPKAASSIFVHKAAELCFRRVVVHA
jgi:hypothetical protein